MGRGPIGGGAMRIAFREVVRKTARESAKKNMRRAFSVKKPKVFLLTKAKLAEASASAAARIARTGTT
jgi:hypothetical protein